MKTFRYLSCILLLAMLVLGVGLAAPAAATAKELAVGSGSVSNTADEEGRTLDLPITLKGGFDDVNGLAFTLVYDKDVFEFRGLVRETTDISNDPGYEGEVVDTIFYYANNIDDEGRVLIAAAAANFLAGSDEDEDLIPFKASFRVKAGKGSGTYPIGLQQTIIGPDTGANAGYTEPTQIPVAVGLAPDADPSDTQTFPVTLTAGSITVTGGYAVGGTVKYANDTNATGATVRLFRKVGGQFLFNAETTVAGNGTYSFSGRAAGEYKIEVRATNPNFQSRKETAPFLVPEGIPVNIVLAAFTPISGKVTINGAPVGAVRVEVWNGGTLLGTFPVDAQGNYVATGLDSTAGYTVRAVYGDQEIDIDDPNFNWTLDTGSIGGAITGLADGQRVMVHVISADAQLERTLRVTGDDGDKTYEITNLLPAADYIVSVFGDAIPVTYFDNVTDIDAATAVTVTANVPAADIDFTFDAPIVPITGTVKQGGVGLSGVPVFALNTATYELYLAYSGTGGAYSLSTGAGDYLVFAYKSNGKTFYFKSGTESTQLEGQAAQVTADSAGIDGIDIFLDEPVGTIRGQVTFNRSDGDPVPGIMVRAVGAQDSAVAVTGQNGQYVLSGLTLDASYAVTIYPGQPWAPLTKNANATEAPGTTCSFVINTGWVLSGTVTDSTTTLPVAGAWVYLLNSGGSIQGIPVRTSAAGAYTMADIPAGIYTLVVEHPSYRPFSTVVQIQANTTRNIELLPGASISGQITDSGTPAAPLSGALVIAVTAGENARYAVSAADGSYHLDGLIDGRDYFLTVNKAGYLRKVVEVTTAGATVQDVALETPTSLWSFGGTVMLGTSGGSGISGATVVISSNETKFSRSAVTGDIGNFSFTNVPQATDYRVVVIPGDNRPVFIDDPVAITDNIGNYEAVIPVTAISGTVTLSDNAPGAMVQVYLLTEVGQYVTDVVATHESDGDYSFTFQGVAAGTYKVAAFSPGYNFGWYADANNISDADDVTLATGDVNFTLTKQ